MKNIYISSGFAIITTSQLALGLYVMTVTAKTGGKTQPLTPEDLSPSKIYVAQTVPPIPLDAFRICTFVPHRTLEIAYTSISLLYGAWESWAPQIQTR